MKTLHEHAETTGVLLCGPHDALLIVDVQRDFLPGGALAVPEGDAVIPALNHYIARAALTGARVFATRDWHPPNHCSFQEQGGPWPRHCVAGTPGAQIAQGLHLPPDASIVDKATNPQSDAYSAFSGTALAEGLRECGVRRLAVGGLATDYCVLATVLDGLREGFEVCVLEDATRAVGVNPGEGAKALDAMRAAGARLVRHQELLH